MFAIKSQQTLTYYSNTKQNPWGKFTYAEFKKRFDNNLYEEFYLLDFPLSDKITADVWSCKKMLHTIQNLNRRIDEDYYKNLEKNEPAKYKKIKKLYYGK